MRDLAILAVRAKVPLVPSDAIEKAKPERQGIVEITLNDGTVLDDYVRHVRGTAGKR